MKTFTESQFEHDFLMRMPDGSSVIRKINHLH